MTFENLDDPEYLAMRAAKVDMLCQDPKYARCRQCEEDARARAKALGFGVSNAVVNCETSCPKNPKHVAFWNNPKRTKRAATNRRYWQKYREMRQRKREQAKLERV